MATGFDPWPASVLEGIARVLGDTDTGFTGTEIESLIGNAGMVDPGPITKWKRLYNALVATQNERQDTRRIVNLLKDAMSPVRYRNDPRLFEARRGDLNEVLVHVGLRINDAGKVARGSTATTLSEAAQHASSLRVELRRRGTHEEVLRYCTQEILERNAFHASLEATKSLADRLRALTGETTDGSSLVDSVLTAGQRAHPRVAINSYASDSEKSEQKGFAALARGLFSMFRNPVAHDPRIGRTVTDEELLETLTLVSLLHRRLDKATVHP